MKRLPNWRQLLEAHLEAARASRFKWGVFDCALAACDAVLVMTGEDPGAEYRGKYASAVQAAALMGTDLGTFAAAIAAKLGAKQVLPGYGRRGDVALVNNGNPSHALGIVDLSGRFAMCAAGRGLTRVPMRLWLRAWQIG